MPFNEEVRHVQACALLGNTSFSLRINAGCNKVGIAFIDERPEDLVKNFGLEHKRKPCGHYYLKTYKPACIAAVLVSHMGS